MRDNVIFERYAKPYYEKGKNEGIIEGKIKGIKEGIKEGIIEGKKNKEKEYVNRLLDGDYSLDEIYFLTGLSFKINDFNFNF